MRRTTGWALNQRGARAVLAMAVPVFVTALPSIARAQSTLDSQPRYESKPRAGLAITGGVMLGAPYVVGLGWANPADSPNGWLLVPVVGPWVDLAQGGPSPSCRGDVCTDRTYEHIALGLDGALQTVGAAFILVAYAFPERADVRPTAARIEIAPVASDSGCGVSVRGQF